MYDICMYIKGSQSCRLNWRCDSRDVHLTLSMWFWHLALPMLMFSSYFSVLYCSMLKAREGSRIVSGKSQMLERMLASKSVSSGQSLSSTANTREKCLLGSQKQKGAVVQIACTFILLVVSHNKPLQCAEGQDCKLYRGADKCLAWPGRKQAASVKSVTGRGMHWFG